MPVFEVTIICRECEGFGRLVHMASETLEISRECPVCYGEGQEMFFEKMYETVEDVRLDYPDAELIKEIKNERKDEAANNGHWQRRLY